MESWVFTIARYRVVDFFRSKGRHPEAGYLDSVTYPFQEESSSIEEAAVDNLDKPFQSQVISKALEKLSDQQRSVVILKYWQEMDGDQIAFLLGKKNGTVRESLRAALSNLRTSLYGVEGVDPRADDKGKIKEMDYAGLAVFAGVSYGKLEDLIRAAEKSGKLDLPKVKNGSKRRVFSQEEVKNILAYLGQAL